MNLLRIETALGADAVALSTPALQAIGCLVGIATQKPDLRRRLKAEKGADQLCDYFHASTELMQVMARACGHDHFKGFCPDDLTTFDRVQYAARRNEHSRRTGYLVTTSLSVQTPSRFDSCTDRNRSGFRHSR